MNTLPTLPAVLQFPVRVGEPLDLGLFVPSGGRGVC